MSLCTNLISLLSELLSHLCASNICEWFCQDSGSWLGTTTPKKHLCSRQNSCTNDAARLPASTHHASCLTGWTGREIEERFSERGHGTLQKQFFLSLPCFYALLILLQLFYFFNLININKTASSPPSADFFNHFFRQRAYSLLLCHGQTAQITQPPSCISAQGFMCKLLFYLAVSENQPAPPAFL